MNETQRNQIKGALLKCTDENANKVTPTFNVVVSSVCKSAVERIEELEQEKCELLGIIQGKDKLIEELDKENAELKEELKTYNGCGDWDTDFHTCRVYLQHEELQMYIYQLTKAKELLAKWVELYKSKIDTFLPTPIQVDTEQFLSEVEK